MYLLLLLLFPTFQRPETIEYSSKYKCEYITNSIYSIIHTVIKDLYNYKKKSKLFTLVLENPNKRIMGLVRKKIRL